MKKQPQSMKILGQGNDGNKQNPSSSQLSLKNQFFPFEKEDEKSSYIQSLSQFQEKYQQINYQWIEYPQSKHKPKFCTYIQDVLKKKKGLSSDEMKFLNLEEFIEDTEEVRVTFENITDNILFRLKKYGHLDVKQNFARQKGKSEDYYDQNDYLINDQEDDAENLKEMAICEANYGDFISMEGSLEDFMNSDAYKERLKDIQQYRQHSEVPKKIKNKKKIKDNDQMKKLKNDEKLIQQKDKKLKEKNKENNVNLKHLTFNDIIQRQKLKQSKKQQEIQKQKLSQESGDGEILDEKLVDFDQQTYSQSQLSILCEDQDQQCSNITVDQDKFDDFDETLIENIEETDNEDGEDDDEEDNDDDDEDEEGGEDEDEIENSQQQDLQLQEEVDNDSENKKTEREVSFDDEFIKEDEQNSQSQQQNTNTNTNDIDSSSKIEVNSTEERRSENKIHMKHGKTKFGIKEYNDQIKSEPVLKSNDFQSNKNDNDSQKNDKSIEQGTDSSKKVKRNEAGDDLIEETKKQNDKSLKKVLLDPSDIEMKPKQVTNTKKNKNKKGKKKKGKGQQEESKSSTQ